jgi:uncharacterized membrane protein
MVRKLLRPLELVLLAVIGAVEWVIDWVEHQSTAMKLGLGMLLGVAATMAVAAIYAWLRQSASRKVRGTGVPWRRYNRLQHLAESNLCSLS